MAYEKMTTAQKADCIAAKSLAERIRTYPEGAHFLVSLILVEADKANMALVDKSELQDLRGRAAGTIITTETKP